MSTASSSTEQFRTSFDGTTVTPDSETDSNQMDFYIIPLIVVLYLFTFFDRTGLGYAREIWFPSQCHLKNSSFCLELQIAFNYIPYIIGGLCSYLLLGKAQMDC